MKRTTAIRVPDHARQPLDIAREPCFNVLRFVETIPNPYALMGFASISDSQIPEPVAL